MSILFDEETAKEQGRSQGLQPRWEGDKRTEKWKPEPRYAKQKTGIVDVHHSANRRERRRHIAQLNHSEKNEDGTVTRGYRSRMKERLKVFKRPVK